MVWSVGVEEENTIDLDVGTFCLGGLSSDFGSFCYDLVFFPLCISGFCFL